jgi:hypothetical protein
MTKLPFTLAARFTRNFAGSATRPFSSTEYKYLPLKDDTKPSFLLNFQGNPFPGFPTFPHTEDEIYGNTVESQEKSKISENMRNSEKIFPPLPMAILNY